MPRILTANIGNPIGLTRNAIAKRMIPFFGEYVTRTITPRSATMLLTIRNRIDDSLVKPQLPSVAGYFQHVVNIRGNGTAVDQCRSLGKLLNKFLLNLAGFGCNVVIFHLRNRKVQLIRSLNVRNLPENVHQLRQVKESAESCPGAVTLSLGNEFVKMIFANFLNSNSYLLKNLPTSRICIFLEIPYSKASLLFPIASH